MADGSSTMDQAKLSGEGFEARAKTRIERQRGKKYVKPAIVYDWNERGNFTRKYAQSTTSYAMQAFHLDEANSASSEVAEANAALRELFEHYLGHDTDLYDCHSFHWAGALYTRLWSFFGPKGSIAPGRMDEATQGLMKQVMFAFAKKASIDLRPDREHIWRFCNSENHHAMGFVTTWFFCGVLKADEEYASRAFEDGRVAADHYDDWSLFLKTYFKARASKGQSIEIASKSYNAHTIQMWYSVYDFAEDVELSRRAGAFLDLYWATWAEEQIDGVRGGGKTRVYQGSGSRTGSGGEVEAMGKLYLGLRDDDRISSTDWTVITSGYRMPEIVLALATDLDSRGSYEVKQRCMGLAEPGWERETNPPVVPFFYPALREDFGGLLRYSYCTPDFVMGTLLCEARPHEDWFGAATQNRWQGVIFRGHPDAAIVPECVAVDPHLNLHGLSNTINQHWSVQRKGTLLTQKLEGGRFSERAGDSRVWLSSRGLSEPLEREGWVFVESDGAYAGVRIEGNSASVQYAWDESDTSEGRWLRCLDDLAVIIIEVGRKAEHASAEAFQEALLDRQVEVENGIVRYTGLSGDAFVLHTDYSKLPEVNGETTDLAPKKVYDSPFVDSEWGSGVVTLRYGGEEKTLKFK